MELAIKAEYEQTNITKEAIKAKYPQYHLDMTDWEKATPSHLHLAPQEQRPAALHPGKIIPLDIISQKEGTLAPDTIKANIAEFKALAVSTALTTLKESQNYIEVKEFKDLVNIVDTVDKSYQKKDETPPVAVFMTNITNLIQEQTDDC